MKKFSWLFSKAQSSAFFLWLLNKVAEKLVPFNKAHGLQVVKIRENEVHVKLPYKRKNLNHIKGIHACALATLCEYSTGLVLISALDASKYRIILKNININYHYQAREDVFASFVLGPEWLHQNILKPLESEDALVKEFQVEVYNQSKEHICSGLITWQIKAWEKVRLK